MFKYVINFFKMFFCLLIPLTIMVLIGYTIYSVSINVFNIDNNTVQFVISLYVLLIVVSGIFTLIKEIKLWLWEIYYLFKHCFYFYRLF